MSKIECPYCEGDGMINPPSNAQKKMIEKSELANDLRGKGYSIREIMRLMNYKSPRSVQDLLTN